MTLHIAWQYLRDNGSILDQSVTGIVMHAGGWQSWRQA